MDERGRQNLAGAVAVIAILALVLFFGHRLAESLKTERCLSEGRHDCTPLPQPEAP